MKFFKKYKGRKGIVKDGLVLNLDGRDFKNNPATNLWYDRVRSETVGYSNLVMNGDFSNGVTGWVGAGATVSVANKELTVLATAQWGSTRNTGTYNLLVSNHVYYCFARVKSTSALVKLELKNSAAGDTLVKPHSGSGQYENLSVCGNIGTVGASNCSSVIDFRASGWDNVYVKDHMLIDLTAIFGAGNEPSVSECDAIFPFTATQGTTHRSSDYNPDNMVKYNPVTWAEWTKVNATGDSTGILLTSDGADSRIDMQLSSLKINTNYGFLLNCIQNTITTRQLNAQFLGSPASTTASIIIPSAIGNRKAICVTPSVSVNTCRFYTGAIASGETLKLKDIRVFELPTGSQIESDFTNLTADQLAIKYPVQRAALPYNFGYIAPYSIITSDFVGKVSGSVVENPNKAKRNSLVTLLDAPNVAWVELDDAKYDSIKVSGDTWSLQSTTTNGYIALQLFSFDLISIFERRYGTIPSTDQTTAGKVAWLKANTNGSNCYWYGHGNCPAGSKAYLATWDGVSAWIGTQSNVAISPSLLTISPTPSRIDSNGFVHFLAYSDASDGVTASTIRTDYVKLDLTFKTASGSDNNGGIVFDGVDDYMVIPDSPAFDFGGGDFTMAFNINMKVADSTYGFLCKRYSYTSQNSFDIRYASGTGLVFFYTVDGITAKNCTAACTLLANTPYRIMIRRIGATIRFFRNGVQIGADSNVGTDVIFTSIKSLFIGALNSSDTPSSYFNGTMKKLLIAKGIGYTDQQAMQDYLATR